MRYAFALYLLWEIIETEVQQNVPIQTVYAGTAKIKRIQALANAVTTEIAVIASVSFLTIQDIAIILLTED